MSEGFSFQLDRVDWSTPSSVGRTLGISDDTFADALLIKKAIGDKKLQINKMLLPYPSDEEYEKISEDIKTLIPGSSAYSKLDDIKKMACLRHYWSHKKLSGFCSSGLGRFFILKFLYDSLRFGDPHPRIPPDAVEKVAFVAAWRRDKKNTSFRLFHKRVWIAYKTLCTWFAKELRAEFDLELVSREAELSRVLSTIKDVKSQKGAPSEPSEDDYEPISGRLYDRRITDHLANCSEPANLALSIEKFTKKGAAEKTDSQHQNQVENIEDLPVHQNFTVSVNGDGRLSPDYPHIQMGGSSMAQSPPSEQVSKPNPDPAAKLHSISCNMNSMSSATRPAQIPSAELSIGEVIDPKVLRRCFIALDRRVKIYQRMGLIADKKQRPNTHFVQLNHTEKDVQNVEIDKSWDVAQNFIPLIKQIDDAAVGIVDEFCQSSHFTEFLQHCEFASRPVTPSMDMFHKYRMFGEGEYGSVSVVCKKDTGKMYALKEMNKQKIVSVGGKSNAVKERNTLLLLDSPFVSRLFYTFSTPRNLCLIMDWCSGGTLEHYMRQDRSKQQAEGAADVQVSDSMEKLAVAIADNIEVKQDEEVKQQALDPSNKPRPSSDWNGLQYYYYRRLPETEVQFYAAEIAIALTDIHSKGIIFRDLKISNIMFGPDGHTKIVDFGFASRMNSQGLTRPKICGTPGYWAPEVRAERHHGPGADWWSYGICIYKLLTGHTPRCHCNKTKGEWCTFEADISQASLEAAPPRVDKCRIHIQFPACLSRNAARLLTKLFTTDPNKRFCSHVPLRATHPTSSHEEIAERVLETLQAEPWFENIDWKRLRERTIKPPFIPSKKSVYAEKQSALKTYLQPAILGEPLSPEEDQELDLSYRPWARPNSTEDEVLNLLRAQYRDVHEFVKKVQKPEPDSEVKVSHKEIQVDENADSEQSLEINLTRYRSRNRIGEAPNKQDSTGCCSGSCTIM